MNLYNYSFSFNKNRLKKSYEFNHKILSEATSITTVIATIDVNIATVRIVVVVVTHTVHATVFIDRAIAIRWHVALY